MERPDVGALFDRDARRYYDLKYGGEGDVLQRLSFSLRREAVLALLPPGPLRLLDVGCGPGVLIEPVAGRGGSLTGVDLSSAMVARAAERARTAGLAERCRFIAGDAGALPFRDRTFDAVTAMGVLEYLPDDDRALREMARVVRPGGVVIVTVPNLLAPWRWGSALVRPQWLRFAKRAYRAVRPQRPTDRHCELDQFPRRLYRPGDLDRRLAAQGLRKTAGVFYNHVLPALGRLFPRGSARLARALRPLGPSAVAGWLGTGYIVRARRLKEG